MTPDEWKWLDEWERDMSYECPLGSHTLAPCVRCRVRGARGHACVRCLLKDLRTWMRRKESANG